MQQKMEDEEVDVLVSDIKKFVLKQDCEVDDLLKDTRRACLIFIKDYANLQATGQLLQPPSQQVQTLWTDQLQNAQHPSEAEGQD